MRVRCFLPYLKRVGRERSLDTAWSVITHVTKDESVRVTPCELQLMTTFSHPADLAWCTNTARWCGSNHTDKMGESRDALIDTSLLLGAGAHILNWHLAGDFRVPMSWNSVFFLTHSFKKFVAKPNFPWFHPRVGLLPRCQLVICCGAHVQLSYVYWMTSVLVSGTYRCTIIDEITRQWQRMC